MRTATSLIVLFDLIVWLWIGSSLYWSGSDPATRGFDGTAALALTVLLLLTALPAALLAYFDRARRTALALALGFPLGFVALFVAAAAIFA